MYSSPLPKKAEPLNVIFIHGWACGWRDWSYVSSLLPNSIQTGFIKLPGSPEAVSLDGAISLSDCAAHVIAYANDLDFDNFGIEAGTTAAGIVIGDLSSTPLANQVFGDSSVSQTSD